MLFYHPIDVDPNYRSGSTLRPGKMLEAFRAAGYEVMMVRGNSASRKLTMQRVLENVRSGRQDLEFVYVELPNCPLTLSNANHWPPTPFLDFRYLRALKALRVPIGVFVRDLYWRFPSQLSDIATWKRMILIPLFEYDYWKLSGVADVTFVPSLEFAKYLPANYITRRIVPLPPGADQYPRKAALRHGAEGLRVLYVGSVTPPTYDISPLLRAVQLLKTDTQVSFTICCYEDQWDQQSAWYANRGLDPREMPSLEVVHKWGSEVAELYARADVAVIVLNETDYRRIAMPIKLFEALGHQVPLIVSESTAFGDFVAKTGVGWTIAPRGEILADLIEEIRRDARMLYDVQASIVSVLSANTWESRARLVADSLISGLSI